MAKIIISTPHAPAAIGTYSQAVRVGDTVYMSGQIGLDPASMQMVDGIDAQIVRVFENLKAVAEAAGGSLADVVKLNVFLTDLTHFAKVNETMAQYFTAPFPARAAVGVKELPAAIGAIITRSSPVEKELRSLLPGCRNINEESSVSVVDNGRCWRRKSICSSRTRL